MHIYTVYILQSDRSQRLYIGQTDDMTKRLKRHNAGRVPSTRQERPWKIIHGEIYKTKSEAMQRERYLKSLKNPKYILEHIISETK